MTLTAPLVAAIEAAITQTDGRSFRSQTLQSVGGGCIHQSWLLSDGDRRYFVKTNAALANAMFDAEADGLAALATANSIRIPKVGAGGTADGQAFLVMEHLDLHALNQNGAAALGETLAELHRRTGNDEQATYGWPRDNFIGATPQSNQSHRTWAGFFAEERLRPQFALASCNGMEHALRDKGERIAERLASFFLDYRPPPSLLHGDLWSGNAAQLPDSTPVIFDPAVYRGDRETDVAMSELFGGFPVSFYAAYRAAWPLDPGYETRKTLYNLYHILNHFNLFGASYLGQARRMIEKLLAELR
jgi:protein-ribulosamine 3-kinase